MRPSATAACAAHTLLVYVPYSEQSYTYDGHAQIAELFPEVLDSVETDQSRDEQTDKLHAMNTLFSIELDEYIGVNIPRYASDGEASESKPEPPVKAERPVTIV